MTQIIRKLIALLLAAALLSACQAAPAVPPVGSGGITPLPSAPLPEDGSPRTYEILDLSFLDASHGWLLVSTCQPSGACGPAIRVTADGGDTWDPLPPLDTRIARPEDDPGLGGVGNIRMVNEMSGWIFGPDLYLTRDGGRTWEAQDQAGPTLALQPGEEATWAVVQRCSASGNCAPELIVYPKDGQSWNPAAAQPPIAGNQIQLIRRGEDDAWIWSWNEQALAGSAPDATLASTLSVTHDGGASWQAVSVPCSTPGWRPSRLAAADPRRALAFCIEEPGKGQQKKIFQFTADGGRTWSQPVDLPAAGVFEAAEAASARTVFVGAGRSTLWSTQDGGIIWLPAIDLAQPAPADLSGWRIQFIDQRTGWASLHNQLFHTTDGGFNWTSLVVP